MQPIRLFHTLTEAEFLEFRKHAQPLPDPHNRTGWVTLSSIAAVVALIYATPALVNWLLPFPTTDARPESLRLILLCAPWLYIFLWFKIALPYINRMSARSVWRNAATLRIQQTTLITDDGVQLSNDYASSSYPWVGIQRFIESPNLLLLGLAGQSFLLLPKRAFPADTDLAALRLWISTHINSTQASPADYAAQNSAAAELLLPRLHFTLVPADLANAHKHYTPRPWLGRAIRAGSFATLTIALFFLSRFSLFAAGWGSLLLYGLLIAGIIAGLLLENIWRWRRAAHFHGAQRVEVTDAAIRFIHPVPQHAQTLGWGAIARYVRAEKLFLLIIRTPITPAHALGIIPERAFPSAEDITAFENLLRERIMLTRGFAVLPAQGSPGDHAPAKTS